MGAILWAISLLITSTIVQFNSNDFWWLFGSLVLVFAAGLLKGK